MATIVSRTIQTNATPTQVVEATERALMALDGALTRTASGLALANGGTGVPMSFTATFDAQFTIRQASPDQYEITGTVNRKPNILFWGCLIVGFFLWPLWIVNLLYLGANPQAAYQKALNNIRLENGAPATGIPAHSGAYGVMPIAAAVPTANGRKRVIVSYRPGDAMAAAHRLEDRLLFDLKNTDVQFGVSGVVKPGDDYIEAIENAARTADALIMVIGPRWAEGDWLNQPNDHDTLAITTALSERKRLFPVLVDGASLPADALPEAFESLKRRQALTLSEETFSQDMSGLIAQINGA